MAADNEQSGNAEDKQPLTDDSPSIEDAYEPEASDAEEVVEDEPELLDPAIRSLETGDAVTEDGTDSADQSGTTVALAESDDAGDADRIPDEVEPVHQAAEARKPTSLDEEMSAHRIAVELKRVEAEVRDLLEGRDSKRKRKLSGTRRWRELQEDIIAWRYTGRLDEPSLVRLLELIARRDYLFRRLSYIAGTRPEWNT
ncbi:MAG: hypothetical protein JSU63_13150 [Phycisphaerales bacterium]|nr:MAG: hypothetical protein JSU63_13150 [Phycisphaerales bacterium]